ncbi:MAG: hypothetical protein WCF24_11115 [Acidimicrobiales bacterium]
MRLGIGLAAFALAVAASQTRVFTDGADIVTAMALAAFIALVVAARFRPSDLKRSSVSSVAVASRVDPRSVIVWTLLAAGALGFELFNYTETPRRAHPTVSSALTVLATHSWTRGIAFFAWLALGAWIAWS